MTGITCASSAAWQTAAAPQGFTPSSQNAARARFHRDVSARHTTAADDRRLPELADHAHHVRPGGGRSPSPRTRRSCPPGTPWRGPSRGTTYAASRSSSPGPGLIVCCECKSIVACMRNESDVKRTSARSPMDASRAAVLCVPEPDTVTRNEECCRSSSCTVIHLDQIGNEDRSTRTL